MELPIVHSLLLVAIDLNSLALHNITSPHKPTRPALRSFPPFRSLLNSPCLRYCRGPCVSACEQDYPSRPQLQQRSSPRFRLSSLSLHSPSIELLGKEKVTLVVRVNFPTVAGNPWIFEDLVRGRLVVLACFTALSSPLFTRPPFRTRQVFLIPGVE